MLLRVLRLSDPIPKASLWFMNQAVLLACLAIGLGATCDLFAAEGRIPIGRPTPLATIPINSPGSYILTEDLDYTGTSGAVISIQADNVSLDLDNHTIQADTNSPGIEIVNHTGTRIFNGKIGRTNARAVSLDNSTNTGPVTATLEQLNIFAAGNPANGYGISVTGGASQPVVAVIRNNVVTCGNIDTPAGVDLQYLADSQVEKNIVRACATGVYVYESNEVSIKDNQTSGNDWGMDLRVGNSLIGYNLSSRNGHQGILIIGNGNEIIHNTASQNTGSGLEIRGDGNAIQYNTTSLNNNHGIFITQSAHLNSVDWNTASGNGGCGIILSNQSSDPGNNWVTNNRTQGNSPSCSAASQTLQCGGSMPGTAIGIQVVSGGGNQLCSNVPY